jgi:hypothetical protein
MCTVCDYPDIKSRSTMCRHFNFLLLAPASLFILLGSSGCGPNPTPPSPAGTDPHLATTGTIEIIARLEEIPEGAIFKRDLYDYATVLKYRVMKVQRGEVKSEIVYIGQYNPFKPRAEAVDKRVKNIGGNLRKFETGQVHHLALEVPIEDYFMGGIVNKYFGRMSGPIYWAVWTDLVSK